ncbi:MAG: hypothetical protein JSS42_14975 [Proteobacteria bacterium]|nr:hypothetical protein [Pseudomonadota bacterium]
MAINGLPDSREHGSPSPLAALPAIVSKYLLASWFLGWSIFFAWTSICAILNFSLRQPTSDEFVIYHTFLSLPFPTNVLQPGSGHRPIFPNLLIEAENRWFAADHSLQFVFGLFCAAWTALVVALCTWRERTLSPAARAACILLGTLCVLGLVNGRMLLHSYESVHVYLLTLAVALAGIATFEAWQRQRWHWLLWACAACTVAMFCFGSGVASFPAVIVLAFALRLPARWYAIPTATLAICLFLYLFALPGDQGVRSVLAFRPLDSILVAADWISSPWARLWLGHAPPPLEDSFTNAMPYVRLGPQVVASATWLQDVSGLSWRMLTRITGFLGIALFLLVLGRFAFVRAARPTRLQALALMFCLFALATAAVISLGRLDYFGKYPEQVWADRYVVWPNLFWCGLAILLVFEVRRLQRKVLAAAGAAMLIVFPIVALPTQYAYAGWAAIVYRMSQQAAAITRSGLFEPNLFPNGDDAKPDDVQRSLALFRQRHLAMFADAMFERVGGVWSGPTERSDRFAAEAHVYNTFDDPLSGIHAAHFEGEVISGVAEIQRDGQLAVLDEDNRIAGLAEFSYVVGDSALLYDTPRKTGFDGYIRDYRDDGRYALVFLPRAQGPAILLGTVAPHLPTRE